MDTEYISIDSNNCNSISINEESIPQSSSKAKLSNITDLSSENVIENNTHLNSTQDLSNDLITNSILPTTLSNGRQLNMFQLVMIIVSFLRFARANSSKLRAKHKEKMALQKKWDNRENKMKKDREAMEKKWDKRRQQEEKEKDKLNKKDEQRKEKTNNELREFNKKWNCEPEIENESQNVNISTPDITDNEDCESSLDEESIPTYSNEPNTIEEKEEPIIRKKKNQKVLLDIIEEKLTGIVFKPPKTEHELRMEREQRNRAIIDMIIAEIIEKDEKKRRHEEYIRKREEWKKDKNAKLDEERRKRREKHDREITKQNEKWEKQVQKHEKKMEKQNEKWEKQVQKHEEKMGKQNEKWEKRTQKHEEKMDKQNEKWENTEEKRANRDDWLLNLDYKYKHGMEETKRNNKKN